MTSLIASSNLLNRDNIDQAKTTGGIRYHYDSEEVNSHTIKQDEFDPYTTITPKLTYYIFFYINMFIFKYSTSTFKLYPTHKRLKI